MEESEKAALTIVYENTQNWIRHYDGVLAGINFFVASIVLGYAGLKLQIFGKDAAVRPIEIAKMELIEALFPFALIFLACGFTIIIDRECRRAFHRIIRIEKALGFYKPMAVLDGISLLEAYLQKSGDKSFFMFKFAYGLHLVLLAILFAMIALF